MQTIAKKIQARKNLPKKSNPKIKVSHTSQRRPPSLITWASKVLCILAGGLSHLRSVQAGLTTNPGRCYRDWEQMNRWTTQSTTTGNIQDAVLCGASNTLTTLIVHRDNDGDPAYPKDTKLRTYFRYHTKILVKVLSQGATKDEEVQVFKDDETPSTLIMKTKIEMRNADRLIFLQVTPTKATLAIRSAKKFSYSENRNVEYTFSHFFPSFYSLQIETPFAFESNPANNRGLIGNHETGVADDVANTRVKHRIMICHPIISESAAEIRTWMFLPYYMPNYLTGAYFFDSDQQSFINHREEKKQPLVFRGSNSATENSDPPLIDNYFRVSKGKFFSRGHAALFSSFGSYPFYVITHIVKVRFRRLPKKTLGTDTSELFYTFISDKKMEIYVTFDRRFQFKVGSQTKTTKPLNFINLKWYHLRITYIRGVYPAFSFDCSVEIEIIGVGRDGQELLCSRATSETSGNIQFEKIKIGGTDKADSTFIFDIQALFVYIGVPTLVNTEVEKDCEENPPGTNPCKLISVTDQKQHCLECSSTDSSVKWLLGKYPSDYLRCDNDATAYQSFVKRNSLHYNHMYDMCGLSKYPSGNPATCTACSDPNCLACDVSNCLGCSFEDGKFLHSGSCSQSTNGDCAPAQASKFYASGACHQCSEYCVNCVASNTVCSPFSVTGAKVFIHTNPGQAGILCDFNTHYTFLPRIHNKIPCAFCPTNKNCDGCMSDGSNTRCLDCKPGTSTVYNVQTGQCLADCDGHNKNFYDTATSSCQSCGTGCKKCIDASFCLECDTANDYFMVGNQCEVCSQTPPNVNYLNQQTNPPTCVKYCDDHCTKCEGIPPTCQGCDTANGYFLEGGSCVLCLTTDARYVTATGDACDKCSTNCLECTAAAGCTKCDPASPVKLYVKEGACVETCPTSAGYYISVNQLECKKCLINCQLCSDGTTCTTCQANYFKSSDSSSCILCDTSESQKVFDSSTDTCKDCESPCLTCETTPNNCKSCPPNYELVQDPQTNLGTCKEKQSGGETITCHETCKTCNSNTERGCQSCEEGKCLTVKGTCEACPGTVPPVVIPDPILQQATLTWGVKQIDPNNRTRYRVKFSEDEILFNPKFDIFNLQDQITVQLNDTKDTSYTYEAKWNHQKAFIEIIFNFTETVKQTTMEVTVANPEYIISGSGKKPVNSKTDSKFSGFRINSKVVTDAVETVGEGAETGGSVGLFASIGTLSISSFFTNSLSFLSKLIQMIEFTGMLVLFNFEFDPLLGAFLEKIGKMTEFNLVPFPLNDKLSDVTNSIASQWKGKLSETGMAPYFLQEFGYLGIPMIIIYLIQFIIVLFNLRTPSRVGTFRFAVFNSVLIDYLLISLRTIGHYPTNPRGPLQTLSFLLASFTLTCFTIELIYMYRLINTKNFMYSKKLSPLHNNLRQIYYEGIDSHSIPTCWFARNYNFLYLLRFFLFTVVLANLQYLQIVQVVLNCLIIVSFSAATVYYHSQVGIFEDKCTAVIKIAQEASLSALILMTNVFCFDTFVGFLEIDYKYFMVVAFTLILVLNVALEAIAVLVGMLSCLCQKRGKTKNIKPRIPRGTDFGSALKRLREKSRARRERARSKKKRQKKNSLGLDDELEFDDRRHLFNSKKRKGGNRGRFGVKGRNSGEIDIMPKNKNRRRSSLRFGGQDRLQSRLKQIARKMRKGKTKFTK